MISLGPSALPGERPREVAGKAERSLQHPKQQQRFPAVIRGNPSRQTLDCRRDLFGGRRSGARPRLSLLAAVTPCFIPAMATALDSQRRPQASYERCRSGPPSSARTAASTCTKSMSRSSVSSRQLAARTARAQVGAPRSVVLVGDQRRRARDGLVEPGEERAQRLQRLADGVAPQAGVGVGRVDGVRQRPRVAVGAQVVGRRRR